MSDNRVIEPEIKFFEKIKEQCDVIFDVGACDDSPFQEFQKEVHYFEPYEVYFEKLKQQANNNTKANYNCFALGARNEELKYFKECMSFLNRGKRDESMAVGSLPVRRAEDYIKQHNVEQIDFLKIDVEGFEFDVLRGFGDALSKVKFIQFEYGGTYLDKGIKLIEVIDLLNTFNFCGYSMLVNEGLALMQNYNDFYTYTNIVCYNKNLADKFW